MVTLNVQFADSKEQVIIAYFASPQDAAVYANSGTVSTDDARWAAFYRALPDEVAGYFPAPNS